MGNRVRRGDHGIRPEAFRHAVLRFRWRCFGSVGARHWPHRSSASRGGRQDRYGHGPGALRAPHPDLADLVSLREYLAHSGVDYRRYRRHPCPVATQTLRWLSVVCATARDDRGYRNYH